MLTLNFNKREKFCIKIAKKLVLGLSVFAVLLFSGGCTSNTSFVEPKKEYIELGVPFYKNGEAYLALEKIVKSYNQTLESNEQTSATAKFLPVKIQKYNGYEDLQDSLTRKLQIKDFKNLPSLVVSYPNLLPFIASANRELELSSIDKSMYQDNFLNFEKNIQGLSNDKNWLLSFGFSSDVLAINSSNLSFLLQTFLKHGAQISPEDQEFFEAIIRKGNEDYQYVATLFGEANFSEETLEKTKKLMFSKKMFQSLEGLINFAVLTKKVFTDFKHPIIALDAPVNLIYSLAFAKLGNKMQNFLFSGRTDKLKQGKNISFDFNNVFNSDTQQYKVLLEIFQILSKGNSEKIFRIAKQDRDYATQDFVSHKLVFSIASSAGYKYYFLNQSKNDPKTLQANELEALPAPQKIASKDELRAIYLRGPVIFGIFLSKEKNEAVLHFLKWFQQAKNWSIKTEKEVELFDKTPANFFGLKGNYISFEKTTLKQKLDVSKENDLFYKTVFQEFQQTVNSSNLIAFREPVSVESEIFKRSLKEALRQVLYDNNSNFREFLDLIKKSL